MGCCNAQSKKPKETISQINYNQKMIDALVVKFSGINFEDIDHPKGNAEPEVSILMNNDRQDFENQMRMKSFPSPRGENTQKSLRDIQANQLQIQKEDHLLNDEDIDNEENKKDDDDDDDDSVNQIPKSKLRKSSEQDSDNLSIGSFNGENPPQLNHLPLKNKNLLRNSDYKCDIIGILIKRIFQDEVPCYELIFTVKYRQVEHKVKAQGILKRNISNIYLDITPTNYKEATNDFLIHKEPSENSPTNKEPTENYQIYKKGTKYSQIPCFFQDDNYFDARWNHPDNSSAFKYMMLIKRKCLTDKVLVDTKKQKNQNQREVDLGDKLVLEYKQTQEMLEIINIFDFQHQQNLKNILISQIISEKFQQFHNEIIIIEKLLFVFEKEPKLDVPQLSHLCVFYKEVNYSLQTLYHFCVTEQYMLGEEQIVSLSLVLLSILQKFYRANFYRLNISLDSIYYCLKEKSYKINCFSKIKCLTALAVSSTGPNNIKNEKNAAFAKAFLKDQSAIVDILLLFLTLRNLNISQQQLREDSPSKKLEIIDGIRLKTMHDKLKNFLSTSVQSEIRTEITNHQQVQSRLAEIKEFIIEQTQDIHPKNDDTFVQTKEKAKSKKKIDTPVVPRKVSKKSSSNSYSDGEDEAIPVQQEEEKQFVVLTSLKIKFEKIFDSQGRCYGQTPELVSEEDMLYRVLIVDSILRAADTESIQAQINKLMIYFRQSFQKSPREEIMASRYVMVLYLQEQYYTDKEKTASEVLEAKKSFVQLMTKILLKQYTTSQDPIYQLALTLTIQLLQKYKDYSNLDLIIKKFKLAIHQQNNLKINITNGGRRQLSLNKYDQENGVIQTRKSVYISLQEVKMLIHQANFSQSSLLIQTMLKTQNFLHLEQTVLYAHCLYMNGRINHQALVLTTALLNYEIAKSIYTQFFSSKHLLIASIEYQLGDLYMIQKDYENAVKCYQWNYSLIQEFYTPVDDRTLEVLIKILRGYVEQDKASQAIGVCYKYMKLVEQDPRLNLCKSILYGQLQLIMGCIYQSLGSFISAILCFQRAGKSISSANFYGTLLHYYITYKRRECVLQIYNQALVANNIIGITRDAIYSQYGFTQMKDIADHCFTLASKVPRITRHNRSSQICIDMVFANFQYHKKNFESAKVHYEACLDIARKQKKDLKYGLILLKIGQIEIKQQKYKESIIRFRMAIEFFERFMIIPQKQHMLIKSYCFLCVAFLLLEDRYGVMNSFQAANEIRLQFEKIVKYQSLKEIDKVHAHLPNKYVILTRIYGHKFGYQLFDLLEIIQQLCEFRQLIDNAGGDPKETKKFAWKFFEILSCQDEKQLSVSLQREKILFGDIIKLTLPLIVPTGRNGKILQMISVNLDDDVDDPLGIPNLRSSYKKDNLVGIKLKLNLEGITDNSSMTTTNQLAIKNSVAEKPPIVTTKIKNLQLQTIEDVKEPDNEESKKEPEKAQIKKRSTSKASSKKKVQEEIKKPQEEKKKPQEEMKNTQEDIKANEKKPSIPQEKSQRQTSKSGQKKN